jgi:g-D-glutamyl-meso-diaminopimelate peptidase
LDRPLYALEIKNGGSKKIFVNAAHHANEWLTSPLIMHYLEDYAPRLYESGVDFYFVPMVNPDGVDIVTGGLPVDSEAYQNARNIYRNAEKHMCDENIRISTSFPQCWKANAAGVDLNSNYPAGWWAFKQSKKSRGCDTPGPREYVGPYPLSEPESAALVSYTHVNGFDLTLSFHTQGEVIYWRYMRFNPPGALELANRLAAASGYMPDNVPDESAHAGYKDWFIQEFNRPGFTIEFGLGENPLPVSQYEKMYASTGAIMESLYIAFT